MIYRRFVMKLRKDYIGMRGRKKIKKSSNGRLPTLKGGALPGQALICHVCPF